MAFDFDPFLPEVLQNPYPHYARLREESPCHWSPSCNAFVVSRFADVYEVAKNPQVFSSTGGVGPAWASHPMMSMTDPPGHARLRRPVATFFTPAAINTLATKLETDTKVLLERLFTRSEFDAFEELAVPLVLHSLTDLIGLPRADGENIRRWADATTDDLAGNLSPERQAEATREIEEFVGYFHRIYSQRDQAPPQGLVGHLVAATAKGDLKVREYIAMCVMLVAAGFGTTAIGVGILLSALAEHEGEWRKLKDDPTLIESAIEEAVRYDGPVQSFFRNTLADTKVAGVDIPAKSKVMVTFASANRDHRKFAEPDTFRIERDTRNHVGFGAGIHFCIGAPLARAVMKNVLRIFVDRVDKLSLSGPIQRQPNVLFRQFKSLPLHVTTS